MRSTECFLIVVCDCVLETMSETLLRALRVPTAKYPSAVTSSHEYGWYSQPLVGSVQFPLHSYIYMTVY